MAKDFSMIALCCCIAVILLCVGVGLLLGLHALNVRCLREMTRNLGCLSFRMDLLENYVDQCFAADPPRVSED